MKKYLLSAALLIAISISAKAQFSLGVKGGIDFSKINTDNLKESSLTGYQVGAFARVGSALYVQPELYVSSAGGKFESDNNNNTASGKVRFTNLNVPVLVGHTFGTKDLNFRLMVGPVYTYALSTNESFSNNLSDSYHDFNKSNVGFQAGGGVDIAGITADLRYEGGLSKINSNFNQRQNLWALSVGFKIL
jgi:hypothetical protein